MMILKSSLALQGEREGGGGEEEEIAKQGAEMRVFFKHLNLMQDYIHRSYTPTVAIAVIVSAISRRKRNSLVFRELCNQFPQHLGISLSSLTNSLAYSVVQWYPS